jgi:hypothetical protein
MNAMQTVPSNNVGTYPGGSTNECLQALSRPRFFGDQLLTDEDLSAVIDWAQGHFGLGRYTLGWGVLCGLSLRCDLQNPGDVIVAPGYARDRSGHDIIVPCDTPIDVCKYCQPVPPPCADPGKPGSRQGDGNGGTTEQQGERNRAMLLKAFGGVQAEDVCVVDVYLQYSEGQTDARHVPKRGCCQSSSGCDYARVSERFVLVGAGHAAMPTPSMPGQEAAQAWLDAFHKWSGSAIDLVARVKAVIAQGEDVRTLLAAKAKMATRFPWLIDLINTTSAGDLQVEKNVAGLLLLLLTDLRFPVLECRCCDPPPAAGLTSSDPGVLLARVWLVSRYNDATGLISCRVIAIDDAPPFRRGFGPRECWPATSGAVNVAGLLWQRYQAGGDVESRLKSLGLTFTVNEAQEWSFDRLADLTTDPVLPTGSAAVVDVFDAGDPLGKRVVAIHKS